MSFGELESGGGDEEENGGKAEVAVNGTFFSSLSSLCECVSSREGERYLFVLVKIYILMSENIK